MNKKKAVSINSRTLKIAEDSKTKKAVLYVWVAINTHLFYGNNAPPIKRLAEECGVRPETVREAIDWLCEHGDLRAITTQPGVRHFELT